MKVKINGKKYNTLATRNIYYNYLQKYVMSDLDRCKANKHDSLFIKDNITYI